MRLLPAALGALALTCPAPVNSGDEAAGTAPPAGITFRTGDPEFVGNFTPTQPMPRRAFEESQKWSAYDGRRLTIRVLPESATAGARFGSLQFERPVLYMVQPAEDGLDVFVDVNRDGNLTNDSLVELVPTEGPFDGTGAWTMTVPETPPGSSSIKVIFKADASMAYVFETQIREGYLQIGGTGVKFALMGRRGVYDDPYSRVYVDADGDGEIRSGDLGAAGAFEVSESYLFIDDRRYAFEVARDGGSLTLTEAPGGTPPPPVFEGSTAAQFGFVDMHGVPGSLADYDGQVVMLYFWGSWCGPCIDTLPELAETYHAFSAQGFKVLAIAKSSPPDDVRAIMAEHGLDWRQVLEDDGNPIATLYRVRGVPDYVLIDAGGKIVHRGRALNLERELAALFGAQSSEE